MKKLKKPFLSLIVLLFIIIIADQTTKQLAQSALLSDAFVEQTDNFPACVDPAADRRRERFINQHRTSVTVIENFFDLRYVENCASAFGLMSQVPESFRFPFFLVISALAVAFIPYLYLKTPADQRLMLYALPFILGGAVGNLADRLIYRYVIDFIRWYVVVDGDTMDWPTFNVADAAIVAGIGLMLLQMLPRRQADMDGAVGAQPASRK
ncbi:MAG: signal peptidase II [Myxococcota bacterium]|nr:signal peptidase II [Myxococcota bacterium]